MTRLFHCIWVVFALAACNSYNIKADISPEERFKIAKQMSSKEDYFDAKNQLRILTLNSPGLPFIDEAQYLLAECHLNMKEYLIAADEYERLTRFYPRSEWLDDARYKIAFCSYKLSPKPSLDPKYTLQAVQQFQAFIEEYPGSSLVQEAEKLLRECRGKLAQKEYKAGELYRKTGNYDAAIVYFDGVLNGYYDTEFAKPALFWKGECLYSLKEFQRASNIFLELIEKYPKSEFISLAKERVEKIESELAHMREANGKTPNP